MLAETGSSLDARLVTSKCTIVKLHIMAKGFLKMLVLGADYRGGLSRKVILYM